MLSPVITNALAPATVGSLKMVEVEARVALVSPVTRPSKIHCGVKLPDAVVPSYNLLTCALPSVGVSVLAVIVTGAVVAFSVVGSL